MDEKQKTKRKGKNLAWIGVIIGGIWGTISLITIPCFFEGFDVPSKCMIIGFPTFISLFMEVKSGLRLPSLSTLFMPVIIGALIGGIIGYFIRIE